MTTYCFDTSAWLEYFNGSAQGPIVRKLIDEAGTVVTPSVVAAELVEASSHRGTNSRSLVKFLQASSEVVPVDAELARHAGKINAERSADDPAWTLIESLVLATARQARARLVTRDPIFQEEENVLWLGWGSRVRARDVGTKHKQRA